MFTVNVIHRYTNDREDTFQNISCLRLIRNIIKELTKVAIFQNISCLRLIDLITATVNLLLYFKTFHVYG